MPYAGKSSMPEIKKCCHITTIVVSQTNLIPDKNSLFTMYMSQHFQLHLNIISESTAESTFQNTN